MQKKSPSFDCDIFSIGEAGLDTFVSLGSASLLCSLDKQSCWLCLNYADKIPVAGLHETLGHNACNNAVGAVRLGLTAALHAYIGDDYAGKRILEILKKEEVDDSYIVIQRKSVSTRSVVLNYKTERTILIHHVVRAPKLIEFPKARWVYLTSLGTQFRAIHGHVLRQLKKREFNLAFNPGDQQLLAGKTVMEPILRQCTLLIVNKEEAQSLLGNHTKDSMKTLLRDVRALGPECVVITDGSRGAYGYDGHRFYRARPLPAHVVERTGAGDAFSTGTIAGLIADNDLGQAMVWGAANSASVIEHIGPQAGLLSRRDLLARIKKAGKITTRF